LTHRILKTFLRGVGLFCMPIRKPPTSMDSSSQFYLEKELYELFKTNDEIISFVNNEMLDGIWYWDLEKPEYEYLSPSFWTSLGYDPKDKKHSPTAWQSLVNPKDAQKAQELVQQHIANPAIPYEQILSYRHAKGHDVHIYCKGKVVLKEGKPIRMLGLHLDISEEVERGRDLRQVLDLNQNSFIIASLDGELITINSTWEQLTGIDIEKAQNTNVFQLISKYFKLDFKLKSLKDDAQSIHYRAVKLRNQEAKRFFDFAFTKKFDRIFISVHEVSDALYQEDIIRRSKRILKLISDLQKEHLLKKKPFDQASWGRAFGTFEECLKIDLIHAIPFQELSMLESVVQKDPVSFSKGLNRNTGPSVLEKNDVFKEWLTANSDATFLEANRNNDSLPDGIKSYLKESEMIKALFFPIHNDGELIAVIILNWKEQTPPKELISLFELFSNFLSQYLSDRYLTHKREEQAYINDSILEEVETPLAINSVRTQNHLQVNHAFCKLLGYSRQELLAMEPPFDYWPKEELKLIHESFKTAISESHAQFELTFKHADGSLIPVHLDSKVIRDPKTQEPIVVHASLHDLRAEKSMALALQSERGYSKAVLENSPFVFISLDNNLKILNLHSAGYKVFETMKVGDKLQSHFLVEGPKPEFLNERLLHFIKGSESRTEFETTCQIDENLHFDWIAIKTKERGATLMLFGIDVSERVKLERDLSQKEQYLEEAGRMAKLGSLEIDHVKRSFYHSENAARLFDVPQGEPFMETLLRRMPLSENQRLMNNWELHLKTQKDYTIKHMVEVKGEVRYVERIVRTEFDPKTGNPLITRGTIQDITERVLKENQLLATQKELKKKNRLFEALNMVSDLFEDSKLDWLELSKNILQRISAVLDIERLSYYRVEVFNGEPCAIREFGFVNGDPVSLSELEKSQLEILSMEDLSLKSSDLSYFMESRGPILSNYYSEDSPIQESFRAADADSLYYYPITSNEMIIGFWVVFEQSTQPRIDRDSHQLLKKLNKDLTNSNQLISTSRELKETLDFLDRSQKYARIGHFTVDLESLDFKPSEVLIDILKYDTWESFDMQNWFKRVHPEDQLELAQKHKEALEGGEAYNLTYRYAHKPGEYIWLEVTALIEKRSSMGSKMLVGTVRDISKERSYLEQIKEQNHRLQEIAWTQSHLLRAPLARIQAILDDDLLPTKTEENRLLEEAIREMDQVIRRIVSSTREEMKIEKELGLLNKDIFIPIETLTDFEVIIADDDPVVQIIQSKVTQQSIGLKPKVFVSGNKLIEYLKQLDEQDINLQKLCLILLDLNMPDGDGWDVLNFLQDHEGSLRYIVAIVSSSTDQKDEDKALSYNRVVSYIEKPLNRAKIQTLFNHRLLRNVNENLKIWNLEDLND